jgi:hypothetical protein
VIALSGLRLGVPVKGKDDGEPRGVFRWCVTLREKSEGGKREWRGDGVGKG